LVYPIRLEDHLPSLAISLVPGDPSVTFDLQSVFNRCYDADPYLREIHYGEDTVIAPFPSDEAKRAAWVLRAEQN